MNRALGVTLLAGGIVMLVFGFQESESFSSDVSRFFTGNPTDRSMWLIALGIVGTVAGLILSVIGWRRR